MKIKLLVPAIFLLMFSNFSFSQVEDTLNSDLYSWLKTIPDIEVTAIKPDKIFTEAYEIFVTQPIDHNNPDGPKFKEQIFLSHIDKDKPMVIELDGYSVNNRTTELSRILGCNQIMVEHRYFGESVPSSFDWKYPRNRPVMPAPQHPRRGWNPAPASDHLSERSDPAWSCTESTLGNLGTAIHSRCRW